MWIRNTDGKPDSMLTLGVAAFIICAGKVALTGVVIAVAGHTVTCGSIDGGVIAAILTPTLGAYVARRYTDRQGGASDAQ